VLAPSDPPQATINMVNSKIVQERTFTSNTSSFSSCFRAD
jgi:hypothetical protein